MSETSSNATADLRTAPGSRSFLGLLLTQFLGAWNDNMFRWLVVPVAQQDPRIGVAGALSLGLACFTLPYLLFATAAGYLADRFSKRAVIVICKVAEVLLMILGLAGLMWGNIYLLFAVVAMMGAQSALFAPSKFGAIPEILKVKYLSKGNGLMGLVTVIAAALGTISGFWLFERFQPSLTEPAGLSTLWPAAVALIGVAVTGLGTSLMIRKLPAANPDREPTLNPITDTCRNLKLLASNAALLRTALGIAFFWLLASLAQMNIDPYGSNMGLDKLEVGILLAVLVAGLGAGSVLAGLASRGSVELGIVPLGAVGITVSSIALLVTNNAFDPMVETSTRTAFYFSGIALFFLGISSGLFNVPLEANLQHRSEPKSRGTILAAANFVAFAFMMGVAGLFWFLHDYLQLKPETIFLIAGLGTVPVAIYAFLLMPAMTLRFIVWILSLFVYRVRIHGRKNLPERGGALLVANHVTWLDGILLTLVSSRPIRFLVYADYSRNPKLRWLAKQFQVIPVKAEDGPKAIVAALNEARDAALNGELVCIFPEGSLTRTGQMQPFQKGMMRIIKGTEIPVIPVYLDELWGSIFSFKGGRFFWKRPSQWPYPVSISFGKPFIHPETIHDVEQAVQQIGVESALRRKEREMVPPRAFLRTAKKSLFRPKVTDSTGAELTGGKLLASTFIMRRLLNKHVLDADEKMVGVLLPPSSGTVVVNSALALSKRVAVNLNYTLSEDVLNYCVKQCGLKHVLTSRKFLEQKPFNIEGAEIVYLEDLKEKVGAIDKLRGAAAAYLVPAAIHDRTLGLKSISSDDLLTVIFTSGSTGEPKGVMLSQNNVKSNLDAIDHLFHLTNKDVLLGVLPFFHSMGFTGGLWLSLCLPPKTVYHFNPLDGRTVGKLSERHGTTIMIATPTFLRTYLKRCSKEQMAKLDTVIVGAEKLPQDLAAQFKEKFGVEPSEGYGTTELSPVAAVNVPENRSVQAEQNGKRMGTVGRILPYCRAKVVDAETGADCGNEREGLLKITGPNVMLGYLNQPEKTAKVIREGWYDTGDFARIHEDGFIEITGRQSRFSKIGGEMVPHIRIEETLAAIVDGNGDDRDEDGQLNVAVTAVPDSKKGERIIVLHRELQKPIDKILKQLADSGLPNIWIPSRDSFLEVEEIPVLGTGKMDLKKVKDTAMDAFGPTEPQSKAS